MPITDVSALQPTLRRAYPTGVAAELQISVIDKHLPIAQVESLLDCLSVVPRMSAVAELEMEKSHVLRIGLETDPTWEELNRSLSREKRIACVTRRKHGILYWNILLSRLGPFWTGYWNMFRIRKGRVIPELSPAGETEEWLAIRDGVTRTLDNFGLQKLHADVCDTRIWWLRHTRSSSEPALTVYEALFADS